MLGNRRPLAALIAIAVLGAGLLLVGALNALRGNEISGVAVASGPANVEPNGGVSPPESTGEYPTGAPFTSAPKPSTGSAARPGKPHRPSTAAANAQPNSTPKPGPNTIELADGSSAHLVHANVTDDGTLPIPNGVREASWWGAGLTASSGATLFAGHVNWSGVIGPFASLWSTPAGSSIAVIGPNGSAHSYRVTQVLTVDKSQLPRRAGTLFNPAGPRRIVLVTCGGEWVGGDTGYAANRIVVAVPA
ncbi:MAG: class F sortase [Sciscionella sp.]|nr:class F sortase [Sciscionella sp.]